MPRSIHLTDFDTLTEHSPTEQVPDEPDATPMPAPVPNESDPDYAQYVAEGAPLLTEHVTPLCAEIYPDFYFSADGKLVQGGPIAWNQARQQAASLCFKCPLQKPCVATGLVENHRNGTWGGVQANKLRTVAENLKKQLGEDRRQWRGTPELRAAVEEALTLAEKQRFSDHGA